MGLPAYKLTDDLAAEWRTILAGEGLSVRHDAAEASRHRDEPASRRVVETPWIVGDGTAELRILEVTFHERVEGKVRLIVMPTRTPTERQLFFNVQDILTAAGAVKG